jgi:arylsulfatase A-like enzyme
MHGSHGLFRKGWPHEESIRVPLLVRAPGAARRHDAPFSLLGMAGLTTDLADGPASPPVARSRDEGADASRISMPSVVRLPDQCDRSWAGVRTADRKLVLGGDGAPWLFFDLAGDPLETRNLAGEASRAGEIAALGRLIRGAAGAPVSW